jgi:PPOX class probable F420-dependent enzyme
MVGSKKEQYLEQINNAYAVWFTTVREDGMPQPTPVWFTWHDDYFLVYTTPDAQKLKNLEHNNKVALAYATDLEAYGYIVVMGEAEVDSGLPSANQNSAYLKKYGQGIEELGMTPDSYAERLSVPVRIRPGHIRGE